MPVFLPLSCLLSALVSPAVASAASTVMQDETALRKRVLAALDSERAPPMRGHHLGLVAMTAGDRCPLCRKPSVRVVLWSERPGIDTAARYTASVCEADRAFVIERKGPMHEARGGPFALPGEGVVPTQKFLPHGAAVVGEAQPWPAVGWVSDDGLLHAACDEDETLFVRSGREVMFREPRTSERRMAVTALAFAADASAVGFARSMGPLVIASLRSGDVVRSQQLGMGNVVALEASDDGRWIAVCTDGGSDRYAANVVEVATGAVRAIHIQRDRPPSRFVFAPDAGRVFAISGTGDVAAYDVARGGAWLWKSVSTEVRADPRAIRISPDGRHLLVVARGGTTASLFDAKDGSVLRRMAIDASADAEGSAPFVGSTSVAWSGDGRRFGWIVVDGRIVRGDVEVQDAVFVHWGAAQLATEAGHARLRFADDRQSLETVDARGAILRWSAEGFVDRGSATRR